jgi:hypothetical protein
MGILDEFLWFIPPVHFFSQRRILNKEVKNIVEDEDGGDEENKTSHN